MRPSALLRATSAFVIAFASVSPAAAQTDSASRRDQYYVFQDELLDGGVLDANTALIKVRKPAARVTLIRPRTAFVAEMLKSVELL